MHVLLLKPNHTGGLELFSCSSSLLTWACTCSVEETASGWVHLHIRPTGGARSALRENNIVVLTLSRPPAKGALEWVKGGSHVAGIQPSHGGPASKRVR